MHQDNLTALIDKWADAIMDVADHAPPELRERLVKATGDLLEAFAQSATRMAAATVAVLIERVEKLERERKRDQSA